MAQRAKDLAERLTAFSNEVIEFVIFQSAAEHFASMKSAVDQQ